MGVLLLVRHGQASFGADDYDVLSEAGWEQGRALGRWLAAHGPRPVRLVHGGMRRHRETWEGIAEGAGWAADDVAVDPDWAEFDHVAMLGHHDTVAGTALVEGADRRAFQEHFEIACEHWSSVGDDAGYPESYGDFVLRARRALDAAASGRGSTLIVTSGGVIAALAATLVAGDTTALGPVWARFNTVIANTSVTRVTVGASGTRLLTFNEHPHLAREQITYR